MHAGCSVFLPLTCSGGGDDLGLGASAVPLGRVRRHGHRVCGLRLESTNDGLLQKLKSHKRQRLKGLGDPEQRRRCGQQKNRGEKSQVEKKKSLHTKAGHPSLGMHSTQPISSDN